MDEKEKIVLGSGRLFILEFTGEVPDKATIETDDNEIGKIQGGASIEYKPTFYEAKDDSGAVTKMIITDEEAMMKSGIMTWNGKTLAKLSSTARVTEAGGIRTVKIGGIKNNNGKKYVIHFLHEDPQDGNVRVTIVGQNQAGFSMAFAKDKETIVDAEFKAQPQDSEGTLIKFVEEYEWLDALTVGVIAGTTGKTKVDTIAPTLTAGNSYKGKIGATAEAVVYDTVYSAGWTVVVPGTTEFTATSGQVLTIIEVDTSDMAKAVGTVTVVNQIG